MTVRLPFVQQLRGYSRETFTRDLIAGLTVAVMLVPQGMAYAMLAGLPPVVGLYASAFPPIAYALLGTSRQLSVGPAALDSIMVAVAVGGMADAGSEHYLQIAVSLAFLVGALQIAMGVLRLGFLVNFLSQPVVKGFTSAAALLIALSQLKYLLGIEVPSSPRLHELLAELIRRASVVSWEPLLVGVAACFGLYWLKRSAPGVPGPLIVVVAGSLLVLSFDLTQSGVAVIGPVPGGLPAPSWQRPSMALLLELLPAAVTLALVGYMQAIGVAKTFASAHRYEVNANQELVALGFANVLSFVFGSHTVTGSLSRSAVNDQSGARSSVAALWAAVFVALALVVLAPLFQHLPKAILASIVIMAVISLLDLQAAKRLWAIKRQDSALFVLTFLATLFVGILPGIALGVLTSLVMFIYRTTSPHTAELGLLPETQIYKNLKNFPEARAVVGILMLRIDASFYFANVAFLKDRIERLLRDKPEASRAVLIDASSINDLDSSADEALSLVTERLRSEGLDLYLANVKGPVRRVMRASGLWAQIGSENIFLDLPSAVAEITQRIETQSAKSSYASGLPAFAEPSEKEVKEDKKEKDG